MIDYRELNSLRVSRQTHGHCRMENTGGEPDVTYDQQKDEYLFIDCSVESPKGRRSLCYDRDDL